MNAEDHAHLQAAIALAQRGLGECWPNPSVGCVLVRGGRVVARARTALGGRPHAEALALLDAGEAARGATAYVSLEPCNHHGHTPPCAKTLIEAGVARVVIGLTDPDPRTDGGGITRLRGAGITVELAADPHAAEVAEGFVRRLRDGRPMVTLKLATTLDGRIATATGASQWITGPAARRAAHALRANHDAILVGAGTVLADDPRLTCRLPGARARPLVRVIADSRLRTPGHAAILATARDQPTWFLTRASPNPDRLAAVLGAGAEVIETPSAPAGIQLPAALSLLADRGITRLLVEGGAEIAASLLAENLVDHVAWFHAPAILGGDGLPAAAAFGADTLERMARFARVDSRPVGADILTTLQRTLPWCSPA